MDHVVLFLACLFLFVGCHTHKDKHGSLNPSDAVWQAETVRVLAKDLREDGRVDYVWPDRVPNNMRAILLERAETLNKNHTGE